MNQKNYYDTDEKSAKLWAISPEEIEEKKQLTRDSIGGYPILAQGQEIPVCKICNEKMVLSFQFDLAEKFNLPFKSGSHLTVFMCKKHDEPVWWDGIGQLPEDYMEREYYQLILNPPGTNEKIHEFEANLLYSELKFTEEQEDIQTVGPENSRFKIGKGLFKAGGVPSWVQDPEFHTCSCGANMSFLCQVPQDFRFATAKDSINQEGTNSKKYYYMFLGNEIYIFACEKQCNPLAVLAVCQCD